MIQPNELRIGSLVHCTKTGGEMGVIVITGDDIAMLQNHEKYCQYHFGIPLTPEILGECGFTKENDDEDYWRIGYFYIDTDYMAFTHDAHDGIRNFYSRELLYLHQLQNLYFVLTGQELEVKLPQTA